MNEEFLQLLGLEATATEQEASAALRLLKEKAGGAEALRLAGIAAAVDGAIAERRITADKREHFMNLGNVAGIDSLRETLSLMHPVGKPTQILTRPEVPHNTEPAAYTRLSEVPADTLEKLRAEQPRDYERLYRAEYGCNIPNR